MSLDTDMLQPQSVTITLPDWATSLANSSRGKEFHSDEEMVEFAIELARKNIENGTGGPFGSAIFERLETDEKKTTKLFAIGVNQNAALQNCTLHAEMVAIQFAQTKLNSNSLKQNAQRSYILSTSCEPCVMCLGGILWSGVGELLCAATKQDAEALGYDEGPVTQESYSHLERSGITVKRNIHRDPAAKVLQKWGEMQQEKKV